MVLPTTEGVRSWRSGVWELDSELPFLNNFKPRAFSIDGLSPPAYCCVMLESCEDRALNCKSGPKEGGWGDDEETRDETREETRDMREGERWRSWCGFENDLVL